MTPDLTIVTGTINRPNSFMRFLKSAIAAATVPTEIIIAEASDTAPYAEETVIGLDWGPHVKSIGLFPEKPRLGHIKGYNQCFRKAQGRYVAWFNDDAELIPGWDKIAVDYMDQHNELGMGAVYFRDQDPPNARYELQSYQHMIVANFGVVRRELGNLVGWFDEREVELPGGEMAGLLFYGGDTALSLSITNAEFAVAGIPGCKAEHHRERDQVRNDNMETYGGFTNRAGMILRLLWNGGLHNDDGWNMLRAKYNKFKHLHQPQFID